MRSPRFSAYFGAPTGRRIPKCSPQGARNEFLSRALPKSAGNPVPSGELKPVSRVFFLLAILMIEIASVQLLLIRNIEGQLRGVVHELNELKMRDAPSFPPARGLSYPDTNPEGLSPPPPDAIIPEKGMISI